MAERCAISFYPWSLRISAVPRTRIEIGISTCAENQPSTDGTSGHLRLCRLATNPRAAAAPGIWKLSQQKCRSAIKTTGDITELTDILFFFFFLVSSLTEKEGRRETHSPISLKQDAQKQYRAPAALQQREGVGNHTSANYYPVRLTGSLVSHARFCSCLCFARNLLLRRRNAPERISRRAPRHRCSLNTLKAYTSFLQDHRRTKKNFTPRCAAQERASSARCFAMTHEIGRLLHFGKKPSAPSVVIFQ